MLTHPNRYGRGRLLSLDERDLKHPMRASLSPQERKLVTSRHWITGPVLDQGPHPFCVGFSWRQWLTSTPYRTVSGPAPVSIYREAQKLDEWPGEDYPGTSVRAGAKVLQQLGHIREYLWAWDVDTLRAFVLNRGCIVMGTDWFTGMYDVRPDGVLEVSGDYDGGHAWLVVGFSQKRNQFRMLNSWGPAWGQNGRAWLSVDTMHHLLVEKAGEACSALEAYQGRVQPVSMPANNLS
jgi:hypothetical protein